MNRGPFAAILILSIIFSSVASADSATVLHQIYARQACSIMHSVNGGEIAGLAKKGELLLVLRPALCFISDTTRVDYYKVRGADGTVGYISAQYLTYDKTEASENYMAGTYDPIHADVKDRFHGGDPLGCDYFPRQKPSFPDNVMPAACYSLYIPCNTALLNKIDEYISFAKGTRINTFVIDVKEDGIAGFKADAMKKYSPTAYARAGSGNEELYRKVVKRLHEEGFWVVGRIVTFKDCFLTKDHPECALWNKATGQMLLHNKSHWPSAYSRLVWEYNVALAVESVQKLGFNEINFDYVRFPDRMNSIEASIEMRNKYSESKVQAIQRFVTYAVDQIHKVHAYVSIDVFGESANPGYTTAYGQYWPAISNVADVICGMPYPDHFSNGYYGIQKPWNHPYEIMYAWGQRVSDRQSATPSPAIVRTWVQAYHVLSFVDRNGIDYNAENVEKEIRGLYAAGLTGGYTTWMSSGSLTKYRSQAGAFKKDYYSEWLSSHAADK